MRSCLLASIYMFVVFSSAFVSGQDRVQVGFAAHKSIDERSLAEASAADEYSAVIAKAQRLPVSLEFTAGRAALDSKARSELAQLVDILRAPGNIEKRIQIIGFGDAEAMGARERVLSKMRAVVVKSELSRLGIPSEPVISFTSPTETDSSTTSKSRVEIWLYHDQDHADIVAAKRKVEDGLYSSHRESYSYL